MNGLVLASLTEEDLENMGVTKLLGCKVDLELGIEGLMFIYNLNLTLSSSDSKIHHDTSINKCCFFCCCFVYVAC